tara:strand:- start:168 stop:296 length:129 start_codon:yes stop_codon:yes gene_type:complete
MAGAGGGCAHSMQEEQEQGHARNERAEPRDGGVAELLRGVGR